MPKKRSRRNKHSIRYWNWKPLFWGLFILLILSLFLAVPLFLAGGGGGGSNQELLLPQSSEARVLLMDVNDVHEIFLRESDKAGETGEQISSEGLNALRRSVELLEEYQLATGFRDRNQAERLRRWENHLQDLEAQNLAESITELQATYQRELAKGNFEAASEAISQALDFQRQIESEFSQSRFNSPSLSFSLERSFNTLQIQPLINEINQLIEFADEALLDEHFESADRAYEEAIAIQQRIVREFPGARQASPGNLRRLEQARAQLLARQLIIQFEANKTEGEEAMSAGDFELATRLFSQAGEFLQAMESEGTVRDYPVVGARQHLTELEHTAKSHSLYEDVMAHWQLIQGNLRNKDLPSAQRDLRHANTFLRELESQFPRSRFLNDLPGEEIEFLLAAQDDIADVQSFLEGNMVPHPMISGLRILRTEVPQELFTKVARNNPSRASGPQLPVESVSVIDAESFLERLKWMTGREFRLPMREEIEPLYRQILEEGLAADSAWASHNSGGSIQPVGTSSPNFAGIYDILGNVAEWVTLPDSASVLALGGSFQTPLSALRQTPPIETYSRTDRSRLIGFRFVESSANSEL